MLLFIAVLLCAYAALFFGPYPIPAATIHAELLRLLPGFVPTQSEAGVIVLDLRLSRIALSFLVGSALAIAGHVFQGLLRNPLADPFTLGISSGAACGAALVLCVPGMTAVLGQTALPLAAMVGAFGAMFLVLLLARTSGNLSRESLVLGGIVVSTFLGALLTLIKALNEESVSAIVFWIMGSFQGRGWREVYLVLPYFALGGLMIAGQTRELGMLTLGAEQAAQLGVNVRRARLMLLGGAGLLTAAAVAVSGIIGFVGLVVPHLVRLLFGQRGAAQLLFSALGGGLLTLWSDVAARSILHHGTELPVGVITALLGGPFFCLILARRSRT